jgi:cell division protein FtsQ
MAAALTVILRRPLSFRPSARLLRRFLALLVIAALLAGGYVLWFRDSSLVAVERVEVRGLTSSEAPQAREALISTARSMSTLHLDKARLERAVAGYPSIGALRVSADFPHALRIQVVERHPAALAVAARSRAPVAGDGALLRDLSVKKDSLPVVKVRGELPQTRLGPGPALRAAQVAGVAPEALRPRLIDVGETADRGIVVRVRRGPELVFGSPTRLRAKWTAAARVLADPAARGATYVDLRLPERPAAGGLEADSLVPVAPAGDPAPQAPSPATPPAEAPSAQQAPAAGTPPAAGPAPPAGQGGPAGGTTGDEAVANP